jgi:hypothetical protein
MYFLWVLFAIPALVLLYTACVIVRDDQTDPRGCASELRSSDISSMGRRASEFQNSRAVKQITAEELDDLAHRSNDVILIDLTPPWERKPLLIPVAHTLFVAPNQLQDILRWLPPASSVVLYGSSRLCASVTPAVGHLTGSAPVYVLSEPKILKDRLKTTGDCREIPEEQR